MGEKKSDKKWKCCSIFIFTFIFLILLAVLVFWLVVKPRQPIFTIDNGSIIRGHNLTANNHLNATFNFTVRACNPNTRLTLYYEYLEMRTYHGGQLMGYNGVYYLLQPRGNVTHLRLGGVASNMKLFESPGEVDLDVELKGKVWYKFKSLNLYRYKVKVKCFPVVVYFNSTKVFKRTNCGVKLEQRRFSWKF